MGGPPNYWPKHKVDHNLRQLKQGGLTNSGHDSDSIMHYSFPTWMFIENEKSPCYTSENHDLSATDKIMMEKAYPFKKEIIETIDKSRVVHLESIINNTKTPNTIQAFHHKHLDFYKNIP